MISPLRKPGRYGLSGRGCLPGHFARAHGGGNSSNSLSKDLDRVRRHWQGPCWVAVVVVDAEVWELKLPRSVMPGCLCGRAAPPSMACMAAADARAHAFDELYGPVQGVRQELRCERHLVSGCGPPQLEACRVQKAAANWLARRIRRGVVVVEASLATQQARPPSAPTTLLRLKQIKQHVVINNSERKSIDSLDGARYNQCFTRLCFCATAIKRRARSARKRHQREALATTQAASRARKPLRRAI